jgi:ABC-type phosphate transport system substrate-binding protein
VDWIRSVVDYLGPGQIIVGIVLLFVAPYATRWVEKTNELTVGVVFDSRMGLARLLRDALSGVAHGGSNGASGNGAEEPIGAIIRSLDGLSQVILDIRNSGRTSIKDNEFSEKLSFDFGPRIIWNARVSEVPASMNRSMEENERYVAGGLRFLRERGSATEIGLAELRGHTRDRLAGGAVPDHHVVRLDQLRLDPRKQFKLVVLLFEPGHDDAPSKGVDKEGDLRNGRVRWPERTRLITASRVVRVVAALATVLLVVGILAPRTTAGLAAPDCATGTVRVVGSTVFMPVLRVLADQYQRGCPGATIQTDATGSVEGVRMVAGLPEDQAGSAVAVSDGRQPEGAGLHTEQVAIVVYSVVVNSSAAVDGLSTAQLRGIYSGAYRDWSQLRGGAPLPIRIVGRGQSSGSRALFEQRVLGTVEPGLTSTECLTSDKAPNAAVIRCERDRNEDVVRMVSHTEGAIAYSDTASIAEARRSNAVTALTVDAKAFDRNSPAQVAYPFWTVEYLYSRRPPTDLLASFLAYIQRNDSAQARLNEHGYVPCRTPAGAPLELCNYR